MDITSYFGDKISEGKTKVIFKNKDDENEVLIFSKDSITAGDGAKRDELPRKGEYSTTTACNVFRLLKHNNIPLHYIRQEAENVFRALKCDMIPLEVIVRRVATGSYLKRNPHLQEGTHFEACIVETTFKDDQNHDPLVTDAEIIAMNLKRGGVSIGPLELNDMKAMAVRAFEILESAWKGVDATLVDYKVEFGIAPGGRLVLGDVVDNDSWRIWPHGDKSQMKDKQVYRNIPLKPLMPTSGTLTTEQTALLEKNYQWVANMSNRLLDALHASSSAPQLSNSPLIGVIMGSQSDWETMKNATNVLDKFSIPYETRIVSAHRTPDRLFSYAKEAKDRGLRVIIAGAGGAAHLPGMVAALTPLPVLGVPVQSRALSGIDSLLSIVQMPAGIPVGTLAIGVSGATNAALLAAAILGTQCPRISAALEAFRRKQTYDVAITPTDAGATTTHDIKPVVASLLTVPLLQQQPTPATSVNITKKRGLHILPPGSTIGILGGGQLGRMTAIAAAYLGYKTHVFCPEEDAPASQVASTTTTAGYGNFAALDKFSLQVDVVTYEFENICAKAVEHLERSVPVFPNSRALRVCQDRIAEKTYISSLGIATASFEAVDNVEQLRSAVAKIGLPAVLKSNTLGYDGKGQVKLTNTTDLGSAWGEVLRTGATRAILEGFVSFEKEVSVVVARGIDGHVIVYPVVENQHRDHILHKTIVPAPVLSETAQDAESIARKIAVGLNLVGVLAVEMFVVNGKVLVNELAPRPHNSGHWTIEGCSTSQFEQVVRAIAGLPLGTIEHVATCEMTNLVGKEIEQWSTLVGERGAHLHIYGKADPRAGRKMGHVTRIFSIK